MALPVGIAGAVSRFAGYAPRCSQRHKQKEITIGLIIVKHKL